MGRGKWWSEDEIVVVMAAGLEVLSLGFIDAQKKQASAKTFYNSNGASLRSHGVVSLSDAHLDSRTARNIWEKFHQVLSTFRTSWLPTFKSIGRQSGWTEEDVDKRFKEKMLEKVRLRDFKTLLKAWKRFGPQGIRADAIVGTKSVELASAVLPDANPTGPEHQAIPQQDHEAKMKVLRSEIPTKRAVSKRKVEPVEESSHLQDMATAQLLEQKLKSIQYLISISDDDEERKHLKSVLYDEVMNVCGSAKKRKCDVNSAAAFTTDRSEQIHPVSKIREHGEENPDQHNNDEYNIS